MCAPTAFINRFLVWQCGVLVVMTRKVFWNAYRQRYAKLLRNRPFSPRIIRENLSNLWLGFKTTNFTNHTNDLSWGFLATNFHELFLLNLCEPW